MSWQKGIVFVRPGLQCAIHRCSHLLPKAPVRNLSAGPFAWNRNSDHDRSVLRATATTVTLPSIGFNSGGSRLGSQPRRPASTIGGGGGWYESISDSTPVHLTEQLLINVHQTTGLPWWASIICTTMALRTVITLPLGAYQMVIVSKVEALQGEIAELAQRLRYEVSVRAQERGWTEKHCRYQFRKNLRRIVSELYVRDNCHPFKASVLVWVQLPMWVCLSLALRNLSMGISEASAAWQSELAAGGALWFQDLTLPDSTWIMPVSLGLLNLLIVEMFALRRTQVSPFQKYVTHFVKGISLVMIPIAASVPSSMALYWLTSSGVGLAHNLLLRSPRFRGVCRIPATRHDSATPYRDTVAAFKAKYLK